MELVGGGGGAVLDRVVGKDVAGEGHLSRDESHIGLPQWPNGKESACRIPWTGGYSLCGVKDSNMTETT